VTRVAVCAWKPNASRRGDRGVCAAVSGYRRRLRRVGAAGHRSARTCLGRPFAPPRRAPCREDATRPLYGREKRSTFVKLRQVDLSSPPAMTRLLWSGLVAKMGTPNGVGSVNPSRLVANTRQNLCVGTSAAAIRGLELSDRAASVDVRSSSRTPPGLLTKYVVNP
jgi:hypothetical protein